MQSLGRALCLERAQCRRAKQAASTLTNIVQPQNTQKDQNSRFVCVASVAPWLYLGLACIAAIEMILFSIRSKAICDRSMYALWYLELPTVINDRNINVSRATLMQ